MFGKRQRMMGPLNRIVAIWRQEKGTPVKRSLGKRK